MTILEFYSLNTKPSRTSKIIKCDSLDWDNYLKLIDGTYPKDNFPLKFVEIGGRDWVDIICPSVGFFVISEKFKNVLIENNFSGWESFDVLLYDKESKELNKKYFGLSIIGKSGSTQYEKSLIIEKQYKTGEKYKSYIGTYFNLDSWDKSDFFIIDKTIMTCITKNAANILAQAKLSNLNIQPLSKKETSEYALPNWAKEQLNKND